MNSHGFEGLEAWIGRTRVASAAIDARQAELMNATMEGRVSERGLCNLVEGSPLPFGWHWLWFAEAFPAGKLGRDGHPARGDFMPPIPLPRRMWAGSRISFHHPLQIGMTASRKTTITAIAAKTGRSGDLVFLTMLHEISEGDTMLITEEQDLVYRTDRTPDAPVPVPQQPPTRDMATLSREVYPDPVWMFRYSALTFNGHRIHYDADYARKVEGYRGIVFHAPLTATLLMNIAGEKLGDRKMASFAFRAVSPLFQDAAFMIHAKSDGSTATAWAETPGGALALTATASLQASIAAPEYRACNDQNGHDLKPSQEHQHDQ